MAWYYASGSGQAGPLTEPELANLVQSGTITPGTLVWTQGLADWQPLSIARPDLTGNAAVTPSVGGVAVGAASKDLAVQQLREGYGAAGIGNVKYAGFWIRFVAKFIDGIIVGIALMPIQFLLGAGAAAAPNADAGAAGAGLLGISMLLSWIAPVLYHGFAIGKWGTTLGKKALGLRVITPEGQPVGMARAFGRSASEIISSLILAIGYIMAAFDDEKRALHDRIASTRVISTR